MAEAHPVGFQWVMEAKERGAKVIHVDPRFTRTSALADTYVPMRAGADIAFLGGVVNYILSNELDFREYVLAYTNAATHRQRGLPGHRGPRRPVLRLRPGDAARTTRRSWQYAGQRGRTATAGRRRAARPGDRRRPAARVARPAGRPRRTRDRDETLQHPRCVYQILKRHFARYTPEVVERVCGVPQEKFLEVCEAWTANSGRERTTALVYSVGWTQHSVGVQYIRTGAIIQLLLGNMGRPGGGIMALRGHASIQGSTDIPTLFNLLPGYLPMPHHEQHETFQQWVDEIRHPEQKGFWANAEAYAVSLLKAYWGDAATAENDCGYDYLPRLTGDHGTYQQVLDMIDGKIKGYFLLGQNPAVGSAHGKAQRLGMANLDWLVVRDLFLIESATFWKDGPGGRDRRDRARGVPDRGVLPAGRLARGEGGHLHPDPADAAVAGEGRRPARRLPLRAVVLLPPRPAGPGAAGRLDRAARPAGAGPDLGLPDARRPHDEPSAEAVLREINGYEVATGAAVELHRAEGRRLHRGRLLDLHRRVSPTGSTRPPAASPGTEQDWVAREWGWAWPANRRILYNRASADPEGRPWSERKKYVWWDAEAGEWTGHDVPDFEKTKPPSYRPPEGATGVEAIAGDDPFIMQGDGKGWLYAPSGLIDGPMPTHYEPAESPVRNPLYGQQANPTRKVYERADNPTNPSPPEQHAEVFPYVFTTSRLTEHHTAGGDEPEPGVPLRAAAGDVRRGVAGAGRRARAGAPGLGARGHRARGDRGPGAGHRPADGRCASTAGCVHQIWLPYHWGQGGLVTGDSANDLIGITLDPNVLIQESKVGHLRHPAGPPADRAGAARRTSRSYRRRAGVAEPVTTVRRGS